MKQLIQLGLLASLALSNSVFAVNPVQGFYGGLMAEGSRGPGNNIIDFHHDNMMFSGTVNYSSIGGGGGGVIGYKIRNFRIEAEALYNRVSYDSLTVGSCTFVTPTIITPKGQCPQDIQKDGLGFNGSTSAVYGMLNGYYDFVTYGGDSNVVPYVGLGIGKSRVKNSSNFINTKTKASKGHSDTTSSSAAQGILGVSYYLDDYTWAGMDYRYLTTNSLKSFANSRYAINSLNFNVNFAFDRG